MHAQNKKAFSLIEISITVTLAGILSMLMLNLIVTGLKMYKKNAYDTQMQNSVSLVMREFEYSTRAASELVSLNNKELIFLRYYDLKKDSAPTKVHYFINQNNEFIVGKIEPVFSESGVDWPEDKEITVLLIKDVVNGDSLFKYFDQSNSEITTIIKEGEGGDASNKVLLSDIKLIELSISIGKEYDNRKDIVSGSTRVNLRNLKTNIANQ